jgi:hypothetical protein
MSEGADDLQCMEFDDKLENLNSISDSSSQSTTLDHSSNNCSQSAFYSSYSSDLCPNIATSLK